MKRGDEKLNLNKTKLQAHRSLRRKRGGGGGGGTAEALRVGDAARNPSPAESVPSGAPPPHAPTCKVWTHRGGRRWEGEARKRGGGRVCVWGGLFLLSPAPAEANWRWQSGRKLWKVWVAWLAVETQGKQAVLGKAWGSGLGVIGTPGPQAVKDPSLSGQLCLWPQRLLGARPRESLRTFL